MAAESASCPVLASWSRNSPMFRAFRRKRWTAPFIIDNQHPRKVLFVVSVFILGFMSCDLSVFERAAVPP